jgi:SAM-dependent methyltransferase
MAVPTFKEICKFRNEAPDLKEIKVVHDLIGRYGQLAPILKTQACRINNGRPLRVLDIGAYDRALGRSLAKLNLPIVYHSVDIDDSGLHDFQDVQEVVESYDLICMFELIEHLAFEETDKLFHHAHRILVPGGQLFISTPNPFHPTRFFSDVSHKQHWPASDLFALLRHVGFEKDDIQLYGVIYQPEFSLSSLPRSFICWFREFSWRLMGLTYQEGILAIATKDKSNGAS